MRTLELKVNIKNGNLLEALEEINLTEIVKNEITIGTNHYRQEKALENYSYEIELNKIDFSENFNEFN